MMNEFNEYMKEIEDNVGLSADNAFVYWFLMYNYDDEKLADKAITGISGDKGIDAIWIDYERETVNILQAKFRKQWGGTTETRSDVFNPLHITEIFSNEEAKKEFFKNLDSKITRDLNAAIKLVKEQHYKINLYYITTGKISGPHRKEVTRDAERSGVSYDIYDHKQLKLVWENWQEGMQPAPGEYKLPIETGQRGDDPIIYKVDAQRNIETWIVTVSSKNIGIMLEDKKKRIFAKNIRGFLGPGTEINKAMIKTIEDEPENFWYYNNGITMICHDCTQSRKTGKTYLQLTWPQIINGQQTSRALGAKSSSKAYVLMKVVKIPKDGSKKGSNDYHQLVNTIVKATNWQNKIGYDDLVSNDSVQVKIERNLRLLKYQYLRKRQKRSEARDLIGFRPRKQIDKVELARSVGSCILQPEVLRLGKSALFVDYYDIIFSKEDPDFYLSCYYLTKCVSYYKNTVTIPAKWHSYYSDALVIHFIWDKLADTIDSDENARRFEKFGFDKWKYKKPNATMKEIVHLGFKMTKEFYNASKKITGGGEIDELGFYRKNNLWKDFSKYSKTKNKQDWRKFENLIKNFKNELKKIQLK